jgi:phosphoglucosamine mutase
MVSALQVLATIALKGVPLNELKQGMHKYPQLMINVPLEHRIDVDASPPIQAAVKDAETVLGSKGRVLLRPSGTEPLIRVMVEGEDEALVHAQAKKIAAVVEQTVNAHAESA